MYAIRAQGLTKYYGRTRGIEKLDLSVEKGDFFGFIGPNGAGKSTFIRTILGLISPTSGRAEVLGMDISEKKEKLLANVGYLPSEAIFYDGMKAGKVIKLSAELRKRSCSRYAEELCERLQLDVNKRCDELSFGNRKKLGIICALQHEPELIVLDEPTSGLDPLMQREFWNILHEHNRRGATIFLSSHILSEIRNNCRNAAIIRGGSIIATGSVSELSKTDARRVAITGSADISALEGVRALEKNEQGMSFLYSGEASSLLRALADGDVRGITITEPGLEEIFMHYYEEEAAE
ncbi:MAG: ABC transporter ATP-binding protein [Clostridia bacterium]|nr:ABC transporter ATP-binding protein [Clostridia bacterium]